MSKKEAPHLRLGREAEARAAAFLRAQGLTIVAKNIFSPYGEIDLIAEDAAGLIFVEVRYRRARALVSAAESITPAKQRKLRQTALHYLQTHYDTPPECRFDAICIDGDTLTWLQGIL